MGFASGLLRVGANQGQATPILLSTVIYKATNNSMFQTWSFFQATTLLGALASLVYIPLFNKYQEYQEIQGHNNDKEEKSENPLKEVQFGNNKLASMEHKDKINQKQASNIENVIKIPNHESKKN